MWCISTGYGWTGWTVFKNSQTASGRFHSRTGDSGVAGYTRYGCSNPGGRLQRETGRGHGCEICADARRGPLASKSIFAHAHEQEFLEMRRIAIRMICGKQKAGAGKNFEGLWTNAGYRSMLRAMTLSARNRLDRKIEELQLGGVMAHVVVRVGENLIESVITRRSAEEMKLKIGDTVSAVSKSTEVMLEKK